MDKCNVCGKEAELNHFGVCATCSTQMAEQNAVRMNDPLMRQERKELADKIHDILATPSVGGIPGTVVASIEAVGQHFGAQKVVLFGSRARGDHRPRSDVDLAVYGMTPEAFASFIVDLENLPSLLEFDAVLVSDDLDAELLRNIEAEGIVLVSGRRGGKMHKFADALTRLDEALARLAQAPVDDMIRDAVIQRFEFTYELAWKAMRIHLNESGIVDVNSPKVVMRAAFAEGILKDESAWLNMIKDRNLTVHLYDEKTAIEITERINDVYTAAFHDLLRQLQPADGQ